MPVDVTATPDERLPDAVEAAAYFVVSECLANIDKHAEASSATVSASSADGHLTVVVADDGVGGAELADGSGVKGLVDRVGALSGTLSVHSPPGGGTHVTASIPLTEAAAAKLDPGARATPTVLPDAEAETLQTARRHRLVLRSASLGIVAAVLVLIWALTGPDLPWIVWPLLGIGLIAALDAWHVLSLPPLREAQLADAPDRAAALTDLSKGRRLRHVSGGLVILNLFLVGVWIASGSSYFWPAWVMLGSALVVGLTTLPGPQKRLALPTSVG